MRVLLGWPEYKRRSAAKRFAGNDYYLYYTGNDDSAPEGHL